MRLRDHETISSGAHTKPIRSDADGPVRCKTLLDRMLGRVPFRQKGIQVVPLDIIVCTALAAAESTWYDFDDRDEQLDQEN